MYALVKFHDGIYHVCKSNLITCKGVTKATYSDRRKYPANIIAKNDNKAILHEIKQNIFANKPRVFCKKIYFQSRKRNTKYKNYDYERTTNTCVFKGNDELETSDIPVIIEKNRNNCSTETESKESGIEMFDVPMHNNIDKPTITVTDESRRYDRPETAEIEIKDCDYLDTSNVPTSSNINAVIIENGNSCPTEIQSKDSNIETFDVPIHNNINTILNKNENVCHSEIQNIDCNINGISDVLLPCEPLSEPASIQTCNAVENNLEIDNINMDVSLTDLLNISPSTFILDDCVRRISFNTTDDTCNSITCQNVSQIGNEANVQISSTLDVENGKESSESEYVPSEDEHLSDNELPQKRKSSLNTTVTSMSSLDASQINGNGCNDENMYVETSNARSPKKNYCIFCSKLQTQLARHLEKVHRNELDVKRFTALPKNNTERKKIIEILRKNGNFKFNTNSTLNNGQLIVSRRPNEKYNKLARDFIACSKCKGFFAKSTIRHHSRTCFGKDFRKNKCIMIMGRKIMCRLHSSANETLKKMVFPVMREDEITRIIRYDELLILFGNKLCIKYKSQHHHDMIRARLRLLGRFLLALKSINKNIKNFESLYRPAVYDDCIHAINIVARYNDEEKIYEAPAVAANLSTLIKHIGNLLIAECIKREDSEKKKLVKDFLKLLVVDIGTSVNKTVMETQSAQKRRKKVILPSLEDIKILYKYLEKKRIEAFTTLQQSFSYHSWLSLAEATLISVLVFNRRRSGEMERILIEDFQSYEKLHENVNTDIYTLLSKKNKKIAEKYIRFCIRGKLGRGVPVLLTKQLFESINLILKFRKEAEIPKTNPYVFALPGYNKKRFRHLKACILLRKFAEECNASQSTTLRATELRKHVATYCIQLNLDEIDVSDLATFMGHSEKIHKDHYRQPLASRDILKVSQYLEAVQGNKNISDDETSTNNSSESDEEAKQNNFNSSNKENIHSDTNLYDLPDDIIHNQQRNSDGKKNKNVQHRHMEKLKEFVGLRKNKKQHFMHLLNIWKI
ncbi:uncharacterized protein [Linepithema humile]|uniref:uncharacterized protein isoform X3 n=1 Tax=Linepithema humile TaxID=83485 RepID=UPI00351F48A5